MSDLKAAPGFETHPDYIMNLVPATKGYEVTFVGKLLARSNKAILLQEGKYQGRLYFPKSDVSDEFLTANDAVTYCPFKGDARYWDVSVGEMHLEKGAWAYDRPFSECSSIKEYVCFYTEKDGFEVIEFDDIA